MSKSLVVELPDRIHEAVCRLAEGRGQKPEELVADWVAATARRVQDDPVLRLSGCLALNSPGWTENHDRLLADILAEEMEGGPAEGGA